jgi:histidine triad (HIT) family protein
MSEDFYCDEALSGQIPVEAVLETADVPAFRHTRPFWPVHIVVIPKTHVPSLIDLGDTDEALLHKVLAVVRGSRTRSRANTYQDSKHVHFHVSAGEPVQATRALPEEPARKVARPGRRRRDGGASQGRD